MNKTYIKNILRDIRSTKGKVLSILIMVMLATMVIVGLNLTGPSMRKSLDYSLKAYENPDISIRSTYPMDYEDEVLVRKDPDIKDLSFIKTIDLKDGDDILRLKSFDEDFKKTYLVEGEGLKESTDILLDKTLMGTYGLGDRLNLSYINESQEDLIKNTDFKVVGFVNTSDKFMEDMNKVSALGKKEISGLAYISKDNFIKDSFDEINISYEKTEDMDKTSDEYISYVQEKKEDLEENFLSRPTEVLTSIKDEAGDKIADAEKEISDAKDKLSETEADLENARVEIEDGFRTYEDKKASYYNEINKAERDLARARAELEDGQHRLNQAKIEIESARADYDKNIGPAKDKLDQSYAELSKNQAILDEKKAQVSEGLQKIDVAYQNALKDLEKIKYLPEDEGPDIVYYDETVKENEDLDKEDAGLVDKENEKEEKKINPIYEKKKQELDERIEKEKAPLLKGQEEISKGQAELDEGFRSYEAGLRDFEEKKNIALQKINTGDAEIDKSQQEINSGWASYYSGRDTLQRSKKEGKNKLEDAYSKLIDGKNDYDEGLRKYREEKPSALDDIKEGEEKITDERSALLKLRDPEYEIATIFDDEGIDTYYQNSLNMDKLAKVFPLFFYLVAMLVTLTTMKRYIEEQRVINGSLKALGYSSGDIAKRFYIYGLIPTIIGAIIGGLLGRYLIVGVIFRAYSTGFSVLDMILSNSVLLIIGSILLSAALVALTVFISSRDTVKESPARLLQGKAPIKGSKILLERIDPLWKRLSFMQKITARNLFRYKSRMFMTLFGVAGCTALIFFGFAMIDSLKDTAYIQKNEIHHYQALAVLDEKADDEDKKSYTEEFEDDKKLGIHNESASLSKDEKTIDLSIVIPSDMEKFDDFVNLRRKKDEPIDLQKSSVVLTQNAAKNLGISKGDSIRIKVDGRNLDLTIGEIAENYVSDYLYIAKDLYKDLTGEDVRVNANYIKEEPQLIEEKLADEDAVLAIINTQGAYESMDSLLDNLNLVIVVITLVSSVLASVVLYNITDVNVSERKRELATIKVLGFYPKEVTSYIYREIFILTLIGIVLGFGLGYLIFAYITSVVAPRDIMLSLKLHPLSFIVSAGITLALSLIMLVYVHKKLKKIDMAEAMSSGD